jgi:hypothetical protein
MARQTDSSRQQTASSKFAKEVGPLSVLSKMQVITSYKRDFL